MRYLIINGYRGYADFPRYYTHTKQYEMVEIFYLGFFDDKARVMHSISLRREDLQTNEQKEMFLMLNPCAANFMDDILKCISEIRDYKGFQFLAEIER